MLILFSDWVILLLHVFLVPFNVLNHRVLTGKFKVVREMVEYPNKENIEIRSINDS